MNQDSNCRTSGFYGPSRQMSETKPPTLTFTNWLKALLLSPGTLFSAGYLALYLLTNNYLDRDIRKNLPEAFSKASGYTWKLSVESVRTGHQLNSITMTQLSFIPLEQQSLRTQHPAPISIKELQVPCAHLCTLLFDKQRADSSTRDISAHLLRISRRLTETDRDKKGSQ